MILSKLCPILTDYDWNDKQHVKYWMQNWDLCYLKHWLQLNILNIYDDRRPKDGHEWSTHFTKVTTAADNTYRGADKSLARRAYFQ
jgi:hypothetical protein